VSSPRRWLVTGGSRGIGAAVVRRALAGGDRVAVLARGAADGGAASDDDGVLHIAADVRDDAALDAAMREVDSRFGGLDVVVLSAGLHRGGRVGRLSRGDWDAVLDVNLGGAFATVTAARPLLADGAAVVGIGAVVGFRGFPGDVAYASSKAGLAGMMRAMAIELAPHGIRANLVVPGFTETEMTAALSDRARTMLIERIPLRRPAHADEIADVVHWVAGASYMTGSVVAVDGGLMAALGSAA
jgi:3-oxoacyl-[acyl-carrier protein] reductase